MPRAKKTRKQKELADTRRMQPQSADVYSLSHRPDKTLQKDVLNLSSVPEASSVATQQYAYLRHDLRKTILLTLGIMLIQLVLYFVLNTR